MNKPGTFYEYNDVRVNRLSLAVMRVVRQPLPALLRKRIMDPIGASNTWSWHGYSTSWEHLHHPNLSEGAYAQGVSGGGHWGGGLFINSRDHARFGLLFCRRGRWRDGAQLIPERWVEVRVSSALL